MKTGSDQHQTARESALERLRLAATDPGTGHRQIGPGEAALIWAEIERLRLELGTLAMFILGATPDRNTQTPAEVEATERGVDEIVTKWTRGVR
jgi:hypothetical protein